MDYDTSTLWLGQLQVEGMFGWFLLLLCLMEINVISMQTV